MPKYKIELSPAYAARLPVLKKARGIARELVLTELDKFNALISEQDKQEKFPEIEKICQENPFYQTAKTRGRLRKVDDEILARRIGIGQSDSYPELHDAIVRALKGEAQEVACYNKLAEKLKDADIAFINLLAKDILGNNMIPLKITEVTNEAEEVAALKLC